MNYQQMKHALKATLTGNAATLATAALLVANVALTAPLQAAPVSESSARYVISLESSTQAIDSSDLSRAGKVPGTHAYVTRAVVKGVEWERLRLGFFASEAEARQIMAQLKKDFPQAWVSAAMPEDKQQLSEPGVADVPSPGLAAQVKAIEKPTPVVSPQAAAVKPAAAGTGRYVISLESSVTGISDREVEALRAQLDYSVYVVTATIKGESWDRLRLGFFETEAEASQVMAEFKRQYPSAWVTRADATELQAAAVQQATEVAPAVMPSDNEILAEETEPVVATIPETAEAVVVPVVAVAAATASAAVAKATVPAVPTATSTKPKVQAPEEGAKALEPVVSTPEPVAVSQTSPAPSDVAVVAPVVTGAVIAGSVASFPSSVPAVSTQARAEPGEKTPEPAVVAAAPSQGVEPAPIAASAAPMSPGEEQAVRRMLDARKAIVDQEWDQAVRLLTSVLASPYTADHMQAREFLGLARERKGQLAHAKAEYQRYLDEYPDSEGVPRVQQRLVGLVTAGESPKVARASAAQATASDSNWDSYGSLWQYYYRDVRIVGDNQRTVDTVYTNADMVGRYKGDRYSMTSRVNGGYRHFITGVEDGNEGNVNLAYLEIVDEGSSLSGRVGRQSRHSGGVLGRFDGAHMAYDISPWITLNGVAGYTVDRSGDSLQTERNLYGLSMDFAEVFSDWDFSVFYNAQDYSGTTDRRAVGGEMRYFDERGNLLGLVDYDTYYGELNIAMLSGSWTLPGAWVVSANLDYRRSPLITSRNALIGQQSQSMDVLLSEVTEEEVRIMASDRSAEYQSAMLGISHQISERFQVQAHASMFSLSGTESSYGVAGYDGTGNEFAYDMQLIGSSLLTNGDMSIMGVRVVDGSRYSTVSLFVNSRFPMGAGFRLQPRLRVDNRSRVFDDMQEWIVRPSVRMEYRLGRHSLEMEAGGELWRQDGVDTAIDSSAYFMNMGYRLVF